MKPNRVFTLLGAIVVALSLMFAAACKARYEFTEKPKTQAAPLPSGVISNVFPSC